MSSTFTADIINFGAVPSAAIGFDGTAFNITALGGTPPNINISAPQVNFLANIVVGAGKTLTLDAAAQLSAGNVIAQVSVQTNTLQARTGTVINISSSLQGGTSTPVAFSQGVSLAAGGVTLAAGGSNGIKFTGVAINVVQAAINLGSNSVLEVVDQSATSDSWLRIARQVGSVALLAEGAANAGIKLTPNGTGQVTSSAQVNAPTFNATSARAAKTQIKDFCESAVAYIKAINVVEYKFIHEGEAAKRMVGFIADDTDPLLSGPQQNSMDINTSIGLLFKAVQELAAKVGL